MSSRLIAASSLLMLFGAATVARADVSLTDQQHFTKTAKKTGAYARKGAGASAPLNENQVPPRLIDGTGLEWFINDEVAYATTSSAVGAASDAVFVGAVEATTSGGGSELAILADAFDGYNALQVSVDGGGATSYNNLGAATADCNGRQIVMPAQSVGGLSVVRKVYVPSNDGFARWANIVSNPTGAPHTVTLTMVSDLGSDAGTLIGTTSSGDAVADVSDNWVTSYEAFAAGSSRTPRLAHVLQSPGSGVHLSSIDFVNGDDTPVWSYTFSVPASSTVTVLNFVAGLASRSDAALKAAQLAALPPWTRVCLTATEAAGVSNFVPGPLPSGPEPTGPASLEITSPTTDSTYTASGPFVGIGGLAGASGLVDVTWESDRGFSGTAQGASEWTIPAAALLPGANVITVTANYSTGGPPLSDTITINRGALSYQLPEGSTGGFFSTDLLIANPNVDEVEADIRFLKEDGTVVALPLQKLAGSSRTTIALDEVPGLENSAVSSVVNSPSGAPLIVERSMFWDATSYGSSGAVALEGASKRFLFGEGSQGFFNTFLLLANDSSTDPAKVTVNFLPESGLIVPKEYTISPRTRLTVFAGDIPELANTSFSMTVDSDLPIAAERAMYFGTTPLFKGGHDSAGVTLPATQWYFGEGATGGFFDTFILLGNPSTRNANVKMTYSLNGGGTVVVDRTVPAFGRTTLNAAFENPALASTSFAVSITSDEPIIAERSMYWDRSVDGEWYEAHNSFGVNETGMKWGLAEGRVGQDRSFHTYILVGNTTIEPSTVRVTFLRVSGGTVVKEYTIGANSRFTIDVNTMVPELINEDFGAIVQVIDGSPVIVERSLYSASGGVPFAAGTNTQAVRLQ
jgi:hypothetical protein